MRRLREMLTPARRRTLLEAVRLTAILRRPPSVHEVERSLGGHPRTHLQIRQLREAGYVITMPQRARNSVHHVRLTPLARARLELPLLVYVAWALPRPEDPDDAHEHARRVGLELARWVVDAMPRAAPASPLLTPHRGAQQPQLLTAAAELAAACDAVVIWKDVLLCGRPDVARANELAAPIVLADRETCAEISVGADPWDPRWRVGATALAFRVRSA